MSELQSRLDKLVLKLDYMGMRVEQALADAVRAIEEGDPEAGREVDEHDSLIDREEVEIEQECVRLLALYQPAAIDLRTICTIIKSNSDLERIADLAAGMGRRVRHLVDDEIDLEQYPEFRHLARATMDQVRRTVRILSAPDAATARVIIDGDEQIDKGYWHLVRSVLDSQEGRIGGAEAAMTLINLAKAMERIGDLCTNIAEDIIFMRTGDIIRHADAGEGHPAS
jgi:phosphate transport system protein